MLNRVIFPLALGLPLLIALTAMLTDINIIPSFVKEQEGIPFALAFKIYLAIVSAAYYISVEPKKRERGIILGIATFFFWFISIFFVAILMYRVYTKPKKIKIEKNPDDNLPDLHLAAKYGHADVVQQLLSAGDNINAKDSEGRTALDLAIANKQEGMITLLKKFGGNAS